MCRRPISDLNHMADMVRVMTAMNQRCPRGSFGRQVQPPLAVFLLYLASLNNHHLTNDPNQPQWFESD